MRIVVFVAIAAMAARADAWQWSDDYGEELRSQLNVPARSTVVLDAGLPLACPTTRIVTSQVWYRGFAEDRWGHAGRIDGIVDTTLFPLTADDAAWGRTLQPSCSFSLRRVETDEPTDPPPAGPPPPPDRPSPPAAGGCEDLEPLAAAQCTLDVEWPASCPHVAQVMRPLRRARRLLAHRRRTDAVDRLLSRTVRRVHRTAARGALSDDCTADVAAAVTHARALLR